MHIAEASAVCAKCAPQAQFKTSSKCDLQLKLFIVVIKLGSSAISAIMSNNHAGLYKTVLNSESYFQEVAHLKMVTFSKIAPLVVGKLMYLFSTGLKNERLNKNGFQCVLKNPK